MLEIVEGYTIEYTNKKELDHLVKEIFKQRVYDVSLTNTSPIIIDAGAHIGLSTIFFKIHYPKSNIVAIEANPKTFEILSRNLATNRVDGVTTENIALAKKKGVRDFYTDPESDTWDSTSGFIKGGWKGDQNRNRIQVKTTPLSIILANLDFVDLLKLDIEGAEGEVLNEITESGSLSKIGQMIIEFHTVKHQDIGVVTKSLKDKNFDVQVKDQGDGLFYIWAKAK